MKHIKIHKNSARKIKGVVSVDQFYDRYQDRINEVIQLRKKQEKGEEISEEQNRKQLFLLKIKGQKKEEEKKKMKNEKLKEKK